MRSTKFPFQPLSEQNDNFLSFLKQEPRKDIFMSTDAHGLPSSLRFVSKEAKNKSIFAEIPRRLISEMESKNVTSENHMVIFLQLLVFYSASYIKTFETNGTCSSLGYFHQL